MSVVGPDYAVYLDADGVIAAYDHGMTGRGFDVDPTLKASFNHSGTSHPLKRQMYESVKGTDFYRKLPLMPDAVELYLAVYDSSPIILTAAPKFGATEDDYFLNPFWLGAAHHKRVWVEETLLPAVELERAQARWDRTTPISDFYASNTDFYAALDGLQKAQNCKRVAIPDERFVCTTSARKHEFMHRKHSDTQILIDDRIANVTAWAEHGGIGVLHLSAKLSIEALAELSHVRELGVDGQRWKAFAGDGLLFDPRT